MLELRQDAPVTRLKASLLGGRQLGRDLETGQVDERLTDLLQTPLDLGGGGRDHQVLGGAWPQQLQRPVQQTAAVDRIGDPVARDQRQGLAMAEAVALAAAKQQILVFPRHCAQRVGQGRPDGSLGQALLGLGRKLLADRGASLDPLGLATEQACHPAGRKTVLLHQRADHARLVQGGQRARRCVGEQQEALVLLDRSGTLHHHRDLLAALLPPGPEALEAVEDFVAPSLAGHHADRQHRKILGWVSWRPRPQ